MGTSLWDLPMSLETLPPWGMTLAGVLYELPTPERPTVAPASSSLPTPTARDWKDTSIGPARHRPDDEDTLSRALHFLPTPSANDTTGAETAEARAARNAGGPMLRDIPALLPTPTVMDMGANYTPEQWEAWKAEQKANHRNGNGHGASLTQEAMSLLPTPTAQGSGSTPESHLARKPGRTQVTDLTVLVEHGLIGASTPPPSTAGNESSAGPHQPPLFPAETDGPD